MAGDTLAVSQAAADRTAGGQPGEDAEAVRQRTGRAVGVAAYRACVRAGKKEAAARIAGEMRALGLPDPDGQLCEDMTVS